MGQLKASKVSAFIGMILFLWIYVLAVPFHTSFEAATCHDAHCASAHHEGESDSEGHGESCVLCALASISIDAPVVGFALLLLVYVLLQIRTFFEIPMIQWVASCPPSRAPPAVV